MEPIIVAIITTGGAIIGAVVGVGLKYLIDRRRNRADTRQVTAETRNREQQTEQSLTEWYREQVKELTKEMGLLKADFKAFREGAQKDSEQYQRQAVALFDKIDTMGIDLTRANKTIDELRELVTELREQITQLLVELAKQKERGD